MRVAMGSGGSGVRGGYRQPQVDDKILKNRQKSAFDPFGEEGTTMVFTVKIPAYRQGPFNSVNANRLDVPP